MKDSFDKKKVSKIDPNDPRFKIAHREAWVGVILVIINFAWWYGFAYGLGSRPVEEYTYVFGLPAWFFYSCVVGFLVMVVLVIIAVKGVFKEVPFDDEEGDVR
jgi:uncharacterized membrane protein YhdT